MSQPSNALVQSSQTIPFKPLVSADFSHVELVFTGGLISENAPPKSCHTPLLWQITPHPWLAEGAVADVWRGFFIDLLARSPASERRRRIKRRMMLAAYGG